MSGQIGMSQLVRELAHLGCLALAERYDVYRLHHTLHHRGSRSQRKEIKVVDT